MKSPKGDPNSLMKEGNRRGHMILSCLKTHAVNWENPVVSRFLCCWAMRTQISLNSCRCAYNGTLNYVWLRIRLSDTYGSSRVYPHRSLCIIKECTTSQLLSYQKQLEKREMHSFRKWQCKMSHYNQHSDTTTLRKFNNNINNPLLNKAFKGSSSRISRQNLSSKLQASNKRPSNHLRELSLRTNSIKLTRRKYYRSFSSLQPRMEGTSNRLLRPKGVMLQTLLQ